MSTRNRIAFSLLGILLLSAQSALADGIDNPGSGGGGGGSGTVTTLSVVTANGFAGTVANPTTTPAITLTTSVTGSVCSNGTALSACTTTGTGSAVLATTPTLVTPVLGVATATTVNKVTLTAPATGSTLTIADGKTLTVNNTLTLTATDGSTLAIGTGGTLGTNAYTSIAYAPLASPTFTGVVTIPTPFTLGAVSVTSTGTQLNYLSAATGTTGTASTNVVFSTSPTLITPALGTPSAAVLTNATGTAAGLTAGNVTTNANLTGPITSSGNATAIASQTGTGTKFVVDTSPTLVTPALGVATATSVAIGVATLGTNALAVTGTTLFNDTVLITKSTIPSITLNFTTTSSFTGINFSQASVANTAIEYIGSTSALITSRTSFRLVNQGGSVQFLPTNSSVISGDFTNGRFQFASGVGLSFSSSATDAATIGSQDTTLSRQAAGVIQFGTTAANASGAWLAAKGTLTGGTLADQAQVLAITATQPASPSATQNAFTLAVTSAGSANQINRAAYIQYNAGYTGSNFAIAAQWENFVAGTGTGFIPASGSLLAAANYGHVGTTQVTTTGSNYGVMGGASGGNVNVGLFGSTQVAKNSATNIGVVGSAINTGTTPTHIGGFFSLNQTTVPTVSAALIADNGSQSNPILLGRAANVTVFTVDSVGSTIVASTVDSTTTTSGSVQVAGGMAIRKRIFADGLTASAGLQTAVICQSSAGELIADSVACLASSERFKTILGSAEVGAIDKIMRLPIYRWKYNEEGIFKSDDWTRERIGPTAEETAAVDSRLVGYGSDGKIRNISTEQLLSLTIQALQELKADNDNLRATVTRRAANGG